MNMNTHFLERLDRRHKGYDRFESRVEIGGRTRPDRIQNFNEIREWCWSVWGASSELENCREGHFKDSDRQVQWCWRIVPDERSGYIYLRGSQEANFFRLKWM
jgi:hypothetical protein